MRKLFKEPITIFILTGVLLYLIHSWIVQSDPGAGEKIFVSNDQVEQLISRFSRTWMRPPTESEVRNIIDNYIRNEVFYREAVAMGLDQNDPVIRQRMRQKMEMLMDDMAGSTVPGDQMLRNYMNENKEKFRLEHRISFIQVYLNPEAHQNMESDVQSILNRIKSGADPQEFGDPTLLGYEYKQLTESEITRQFGADFTNQIVQANAGEWTGPVYSGLGTHVIKVTRRIEGRMPELSAVRNIVEREWMVERTKELKKAAYQKLLQNYEIVYEADEVKE
jgi:hypothetical protein